MAALALATLDAVGLHQSYIHADREYTLQAVGQTLLHLQHTADVVAEEVAAHLNLHLQSVEVVLAIHDEHILWLELLHLEDDALNLRWEYIDTADDEHIVASSHDSAHTN